MPAPRNVAKPRSRHRRVPSKAAAAGLLDLPAAGCSDPVPDLPPGREWSDAERARWDQLWTSPQATAWDESAIGTAAALVVYEGAVFRGEASAWMAQEARHAAEALGLTPRSMAFLGWRIV